jgi:hypothetical protein
MRYRKLTSAFSTEVAANVQLAADNFQRADENPLTFPWSAAGIYSLPQLLNNSSCAGDLAVKIYLALHETEGWPGDQYCQARLVQLKANSGYIALILRSDATARNFYYADLDASPGFGGIGISTPFNLQKFVNGVIQPQAFANFGHIIPQIGDVFLVVASGATISAFQNGILIGSFTDPSPILTGSPGFLIQTTAMTTDVTDASLSDWVAGFLGSEKIGTDGGDYSFGRGSQEFLVNSPATVAQAILTALLLHQGEWFLDLTAGVPYDTQILGFGTTSLYDAAIKNAILGVQGVLSILSYSSSLDAQRNLKVDVRVDTIYGVTGFTTSIPNSLRGFGVGPFAQIPFGGGG